MQQEEPRVCLELPCTNPELRDLVQELSDSEQPTEYSAQLALPLTL